MHTNKGIFVQFKVNSESDDSDSKFLNGFIMKRHLFENSENSNNNNNNEDEEEEEKEDADLNQASKNAKNLNKEDLIRLFPLNSELKSKVKLYDYTLLEDLLLLTCRKSLIASEFISYSQLNVGQVLDCCRVRQVNEQNGGVSVSIGAMLNGFIPRLHTGDTPLTDLALLKKRMKQGAKLKCRIIQLNVAEKKCILTNKRSLVRNNADINLLNDLNLCEVGMKTLGVITSIQKYGLIVSFLNELKGLLPIQEIRKVRFGENEKRMIQEEDLSQFYKLGQLVECFVSQVNKEKGLIKLALTNQIINNNNNSNGGVDHYNEDEQKKNEKEERKYEIGDLISEATLIKMVNNESEGYLLLKLFNCKQMGIIYKQHLSDLEFLNDFLFNYYSDGSVKLNNLMVIGNSVVSNGSNKAMYHLTMKSTVIKDEKTLSSVNDLSVNEWHSGWIRKQLSDDRSFLIELPFGLVGFSHLNSSSLIDFYLNQQIKLKNYSTLVKIKKIFHNTADTIKDQDKFTCTFKQRFDLMQHYDNDLNYMIKLFKSYLWNVNRVLLSSSSQFFGGRLRLGQVVDVAVKRFDKSRKKIECCFIDSTKVNEVVSENLIGIAFVDEDSEYKMGTKLKALILCFDALHQTFCLTVNKKEISQCTKHFDSSFRAKIVCKSEHTIKAQVIYTSRWFCLLSMKQHAKGLLAIMPLFKNDFTQLHKLDQNNEDEEEKNFAKIDSKIKREQLLELSKDFISNVDSEQQFHFNYYSIGQLINVRVVKEEEEEEEKSELLIVTQDMDKVKRYKKQMLAQLTDLYKSTKEEEEEEDGDTTKKRKLNNDDEILIKRKKLIQNKLKRKKDETLNNQMDSLEIVSEVKKKSKIKKNDEEEEAIQFPWEVNDLEKFEKVINNIEDEKKENEMNGTNGKDDDDDDDDDDKEKEEEPKSEMNNEMMNEETANYETLLAKEPNNSSLWIKYIQLYLQSGNVDRARYTTKEALRKIIYREEMERFNVWIAWLNLENQYGTQSHLDDVFNQAVQNCDSFKVHCFMAEIYAKSKKLQEAESIFIKMTRKFSKQVDTWIRYATFHYKNENCELARKLLIKSLNSLDKIDHVDVTNKFAQLEFKYGDVERAKTMFENLLFTYANRTDIWSVYIDLLIKYEKYEDVRTVFNSIMQKKLSAKRMKFIFKKFLDFEKKHGTVEQLDNVRKMAQSYVEK